MASPKHKISAARIILNEHGEVLLIKGPRRGWEMPGGQVEKGESLQAAAIRETKEETGIDVEIIQFCGVFHRVGGTVSTLFLGRPIGETLTTSAERLEVVIFRLKKRWKW